VPADRIELLLHEAAETHHLVYRITDGDEPDWASGYADWLLRLAEFAQEVGRAPVRSHLVDTLVELDRTSTHKQPEESRECVYARELLDRFSASRGPDPGT
jgi:hypothetical protein